MHEDEAVFDGGDVWGDGGNIASRFEEMADARTINILGYFYRHIKYKAGINAEFI
jgi:class 3 adenylate cyclase